MVQPAKQEADLQIRVADSLGAIEPGDWDALANPDASRLNPFVSHAFLSALERAGAVGGRSGWKPSHILLETSNGTLLGAMPAYLKSHSQGEYVFDHGWADAYARAGGMYYPKLQAAVPFTPVPGPRLLVGSGPEAAATEATLAMGAIEVAKQLGVSSLHVTFVEEPAWGRLAGIGYLQRTDQQFHWANRDYVTFDDFLASLASRKRKTVRKEREQALSPGITVEWLTGRDITEAHWDVFYQFYTDTGSRKWGRPYLNRRFFSMLGEAMADRCLLILANRDGRSIAGALNLIGGDTLYGRYWGALEQHPCLHFEICYYQAIQFAIEHKLDRVEAGAQGEHKLARGYVPAATYSSHWIAEPSFKRAVDRYLEEERQAVAEHRELLAEHAPYRKVVDEQD